MKEIEIALKTEELPHYTFDDYTKWEGQWELIHGIPYAMTPAPAKKHQWLSVEIMMQMKEQLKNCPRCEVFPPVDWPITEDTVVQPDVLLVCDESLEGNTLQNTPVVVFEILSPSTRTKDQGVKYRLYEAAGVKYYCIVDPETGNVNVFVLQDDKYIGNEMFHRGEIFFDLGPCRVRLDFNRLQP